MTVRRGMAGLRGERGSTTATVIVFPALLTLLMVVLQFALAFHGKAVLTAAAQDATRAAQLAGGDEAAGRTEAELVVAESGTTVIRDLDIDVTLSPDGREVTTTVAGTVMRLLPIPGLQLHIAGSASGPTEEFRAERQG